MEPAGARLAQVAQQLELEQRRSPARPQKQARYPTPLASADRSCEALARARFAALFGVTLLHIADACVP
eukprot:8281928-Alexandrium_andersonii.AAC.1